MQRISSKKAKELIAEKKLKNKIYSMGDGLCELCHREPISDRGHEIVFRSSGGSPLNPFNIIQLCQHCHDKQHHLIRDEPSDDIEYLQNTVRDIRLSQGYNE